MSNRAARGAEALTFLCLGFDGAPPAEVVVKVRDIRLRAMRDGLTFEEAAEQLVAERCPICNPARVQDR